VRKCEGNDVYVDPTISSHSTHHNKNVGKVKVFYQSAYDVPESREHSFFIEKCSEKLFKSSSMFCNSIENPLKDKLGVHVIDASRDVFISTVSRKLFALV
jgi:hypothetical protein